MKLNERLASDEMIGPNTFVHPDYGITRRRPIVCVDGFTMSVQANESMYCTPQTNHGPWTEVEVWYQGESEPRGYVPVEDVAEVIKEHGGFSHYGDQFNHKVTK